MKLVSIILILFAFIFSSYSAEYTPLRDLSFTLKERASVSVHGYAFEYEFYILDGKSNTNYISHANNFSKLILEYSQSYGLPLKECKPSGNVEIFEVDVTILNDVNRFGNWKDPADTVWGLYDSIMFQPNDSAIMITDHGSETNNLIFAHELAHYWFDRFCWDRYWTLDSEAFAKEAQSYVSYKIAK